MFKALIVLFFVLLGLCIAMVGGLLYLENTTPINVTGVLLSVEYGDRDDLVLIGKTQYQVDVCNSEAEIEQMIGKTVILNAAGRGCKATLMLVNQMEGI